MASFTPRTPHFFKILLAHTLEEGKLELPKKFVRKNGGSLLDKQACLKLPGGAKWDVELKKGDGKFWFQKGWLEFVEFYSVQLGYFLVFRYDGNCSFHVLIFDHSATEIQYPVKEIRHRNHTKVFYRQPEFRIPKSEFQDDHEDSGDDVSRKRGRCKTEAACSLSNNDKIMKAAEKNISNAREMKEPSTPRYQYKGGESRSGPIATKPEPPSRMRPLTESQERVLRRASSFKLATANPSFMVIMRPSYFLTGNYLSLPRSFSERHFRESMDVELEVSDGRIWSVWCGVRWAFTRRRTELKAGWKRFAVDNNLQEGDICVFEMIKGAKMTLKVTIFRLCED